VIGVAGPMSGPLAHAGKQYRDAVSLAAKEINARGGLNGAKIRVVTADDQATPKTAVTAANQLVAQNATIVVGHYNSTPTLAASTIYTRNDILLIAPQAIIGKLTDNKAWNVFRLGPRDDDQAAAAIQYLARRAQTASEGQFAKRIALVHDTSTFARKLDDLAVKELKDLGLDPALRGEIPPGTRQSRSIASLLASRITSAKIGAVYWTGGSTEAGQFLTALRTRNSKALFIGTEALASADFINGMSGTIASGVRMTSPASGTVEPAATVIFKKLSLAESTQDKAPAITAYAAMQVVIQAARIAASNSPRKIAATLHSGRMFLTVTGSVSFDEKGDRKEKLYRILRWRKADDGKLIYGPGAAEPGSGGK
ncbi:MAG: branched-chain amino acid ABC transporter substrate-binding protein, partial [Beijerinckiaceae bacterium]|nr:branched-chain amino acid ABC transporter substrate-binding protein [Beijerinckiaceae bacterium]